MRVFLDTNVFVNGLRYRDSNSGKILDLAESKQIRAVTSEFALVEVARVLRRLKGRQYSYWAINYVKSICWVVPRRKITRFLVKLKGTIKDKDLENIATVRALGLQWLVSNDRDYVDFPEYKTPRLFVALLGLEPENTEY